MFVRIAAFAFAGLLVACSVGDANTQSEDLVTSAPKPPAGLMLRGGGVPPSSATYMNSTVAYLLWQNVQKTATSAPDWSTLDAQLKNMHDANISHVRVRIMSGQYAPPWVRALGAPNPKEPYFQGTVPTSVVDCSGAAGPGVAAQNVQGPSACVPFFWTKAYLDAYQALMTSLESHLVALDLSTHSDVATVVDSACMVIYAEVFYRGQGVDYTNQTLYDAGLTHSADIGCQKRAIDIHKSVFGAKRRTSVAINDWDVVQGTPGSGGNYRTKVWNDPNVWGTYQFAEWAKSELDFGQGTLLEVQNNGLHSNSSCSGDPTNDYFCYIAQFQGRHGFQTQSYEPTPKSPSGASLTLLEDLDNGLKMHAEYIELPSGMTDADWKLMACYDHHLRVGDTSPCPH
jgi:hypothetical protein